MTERTLEELHSTVQSQGVRVSLTADIFQSGRLPKIFGRFLNTSSLALSNVVLSSLDSDRSFHLDGSMSLLGFSEVKVRFHFFKGQVVANGSAFQLECVIQVIDLQTDWVLGGAFDGFPAYLDYSQDSIGQGLQESFLATLSFRDVQLVFSTFDFQTHENRASLDHTYSGPKKVADIDIGEGITFSSNIATDAEYWSIVKLIHPSIPLKLAIVAQIKGDNRQLLSIKVTAKTPGLTYAPIDSFSLSLNELSLVSGLDKNSVIAPKFGFEGVINETLSVTVSVDIGNTHVRIEGSAARKHVIAFPDMVKLFGVPDSALQAELPENTGVSFFSQLGLEYIELDFSVSPVAVNAVSIVVSTEKPWLFFDSKISLTPVFAFNVTDPASDKRVISLNAIGEWKLNQTRFQTLVNPTQGWVAAEMMPGETLDIAELFRVWMPGIPAPEIELTAMRFTGNLRSKSYMVQLGADVALPLKLGAAQLYVNDIQFWAEFGQGARSSWNFSGSVLLGIFRLEIAASHSGNDNWLISGGVATTQPIQLDEAFAALLRDLHPEYDKSSPTAIPREYGSASINTLFVEYDSAQQPLSAFLDLELKIDLTEYLSFEELLIALEFNETGFSNGYVQAKLKFDGVEISLKTSSDQSQNIIFEGKSAPNEPIHVGKLLRDIVKKFSLANTNFPSALESLSIENLAVAYNTGTKDFTFTVETQFPIDKKELDAVVKIELAHNNGKYTRKFSGIVKVGDLEFDLIFNQEQDADTIFLAAYENKAGKDENIKSLAELITDNADILAAADGISFNLKDALLVVDKGTETRILFGLDIGGGLDISKLPLVGKMFPADSTVRITFQPLLTNKDFAVADLSKVSPLVPGGGYQLPQEAKKGIGFNMQLLIGQEAIDLSLPIGVDSVKGQPPTSDVPSASTTSTDIATASPPATSANIKWFAIQKQLGPVDFGRVGIQYQDSQLYFLLDASLSLAELNISLDGLFASSTLNPIHPRFGLHGLGIDYKKGPLEIGGAFLRQTLTDAQGNTYDTYDGTAIIRTEKFELAALGSYAYYQGHPSLFIYAFVDVPLGGPAFFFVTGLAAGFGYNRRVVVPGIEGVKTFPLVAEAISPVPGAATDLSTEINKLHEVIPPAVGEYFLAVGIRFSSFEIIDSFVLLTVSFGQEFEVDVLGLSTLVIPTPDAGAAVEPLAEVQMALKAVFNPDKGYLKVRAGLTSASFILSRNCHLTGGFAFYTWFKDNPEEKAVAGDFVLTLGGYHPRFKPPAYYPKVAPLGFNWPVTRELVVKGDFYFVLVPSAVMAGGHLSAIWTSGNLKAWFQMGADFIISWKPYFYDASMYLDMGVSYTYHFFGTHHISVDVGADLHIWGPEFSGKAHVHLWIVTFDVTFGAHTSQEPPELTWDEFRNGLLPANSKWANVTVTKGLVKQLGTDDDPLFVINPKDFVMETSSALPITRSNHSLADSNKKINIGSMKIGDDKVDSKHDITIKLGATDMTSDFTFTPVKKHVPGALWGRKFKHSESETENERLVKNACMGFSITGKPVTPSKETHDVRSEKLLNEDEDFGKPVAYGAPVSLDGQWLKTKGVRETVAQQIEAKHTQRSDLLKELGLQQAYHPNKELADEFILRAA